MSLCQPDNTIILMPCYKEMEPETRDGILELKKRGWTTEVQYGHSAIDGARSKMASWALARGFEYLFWIDSDMAFTSKDFIMVAQGGDRFACAPYMLKTMQGHIAVIGADIGPDTRGLKEIEACGFGFVKTHRSIYESMIQSKEVPACQNSPASAPFFPFFQPRIWTEGEHKRYYGEDYTFCMLARRLGHKLWCNFDTRVRHIGRYAYDWRVDSAGTGSTVPKVQAIQKLGG